MMNMHLTKIIQSGVVIAFFLMAGHIYGQNTELRVVDTPKKIAGGRGETFMAPQFSPDGSKLAFTKPRYKGIWIMDVEDGQVRQISDENGAGFGFSWSPDSKAILARVSQYQDYYRYTAVKIFNVIDQTQSIVLDYQRGISGIPKWTDGGKNIVVKTRQGMEVTSNPYRVDLKSSVTDEKGVQLFSSNRSIGLWNTAASDMENLQPLGPKHYINICPSPDHSKVVFEVVGGNMYVMNADGSNVIDLGRGHRPDWSPDGQYIVYMISEDDGHVYTSSDIFAIRPDGSGKTRLTDVQDKLFMNPSWSPDGGRIACDALNDGSIYIIEVVY